MVGLKVYVIFGGSSNGRTLAFEANYHGSNPCPPAEVVKEAMEGSRFSKPAVRKAH